MQHNKLQPLKWVIFHIPVTGLCHAAPSYLQTYADVRYFDQALTAGA